MKLNFKTISYTHSENVIHIMYLILLITGLFNNLKDYKNK